MIARGIDLTALCGGIAFIILFGMVLWAFVAMERSRHAALVEIARLAAKHGENVDAAEGL